MARDGRTNCREDASSSRRRLQMELPSKTMERLERLKASLEAVSYAEVMKDALRLLEYEDNKAFVAIAGNGKPKQTI